jgi:hypothetical protein
MTTIDKRTDPRREERLDERLVAIANRGAHGARYVASITADGKHMLDLLELAQRGLTSNTITDSGHRYHNPPEGNILGVAPGRYIAVYFHVEAKLTEAGRERLRRLAEVYGGGWLARIVEQLDSIAAW